MKSAALPVPSTPFAAVFGAPESPDIAARAMAWLTN